ncbi:MAG TPA: hypothetical protein VMH83_06250 [Candidatus Acidoferrum sp.]|nr:hypothetical protein [Candidatus Acidoferrum sp.]
MKPLTLTVASGGAVQFDVTGIFCQILSTNGLLTVKTSATEIQQLTTGDRWFPKTQFEWLRFENETGASITFTFRAGLDRVDSVATTVNVPSHPVTQDPTSNPWVVANKSYTRGTLVPATVGTSQVSLTGAPANNGEVIVSLPSTAAGPIWIGPSGVVSATGIQVAPGMQYVLSNCNWEVFGIALVGGVAVSTLIQGY